MRANNDFEALDSREWYTPLEEACYIGNYKIVKELIKVGADVNYQDIDLGWTPLLFAVNSSNYDNNNKYMIIELLLKNGANPNIWGSTYGELPLKEIEEYKYGFAYLSNEKQRLIRKKNAEIYKLLEKYGAKLSANKFLFFEYIRKRVAL